MVGDGALATLYPPNISRVCARLLGRAQAELEREERLRECLGEDREPDERYTWIEPRAVTACRPLFATAP